MNSNRRAVITAICSLGVCNSVIGRSAAAPWSPALGKSQVETLADYESLRAFSGNALVVQIRNFRTGGYFLRDVKDDSSVDDNGIIIVDRHGRRWKRDISGARIKASWFGVLADGVTDDWHALMSAGRAAQAHRRDLDLPAGTIKISKGFVHPPQVSIFGAGIDKTTVRCEARKLDFAMATCWHFGTYGPGNSSQGTPKFEPGYSFKPVKSGRDVIVLADRDDVGRFVIGDLVSVEGSKFNKNSLNTPNEAAKISEINISTGTLKLDAPLRSDYLAGEADLKVRKLNTGTPAPVSLTSLVSGLTAYALIDVTLSDLTLISTAKGYCALNVSCFDCDLKRIRAIGYNSIAGNPCARSRFVDCYGEHMNTPFEVAYLSHDTRVENCRFKRVARSPEPAQVAGVWVNNGEGAKFIFFEDVEVVDDDPDATSAHPAVEINGEGNRWLRGSVYSTRPVDAIQVGSGSVVDGVTVLRTGRNGIVPGGAGGTVINSTVYGTPPGRSAIYLPPSAIENRIENNKLGHSGRNAADGVADLSGSGKNIKRNNDRFLP